MSQFDYKKVLILGATSGIGKDLAERILSESSSSKVIVVGRRQENLDAFVKENGAERSTGVKFDVTDLGGMEAFAKKITSEHPDLDMVVFNSGIQRSVDFSKPEEVDLDTLNTEIITNYTSVLHGLKAFLPFLLSKAGSNGAEKNTAILFVTSILALVPMVRCGNYCASKAALHQLVVTIRAQMEEKNVKVIEILPPAVQTELHDAKHQPEIKDGGQIGIPLKEFTDAAWAGLAAGKESIPVGQGVQAYENIEVPRLKAFEGMRKALAATK